jgi:putative DNA primase/helicase
VRLTHFVNAADVRPIIMPMLWRGRVPLATLTVIAGKPGLGKTTLSTLVAAELSCDGYEVVISNAEDDVASVTRPRLDVAGAVLERCHIVPPSSTPELPRDLDELEAMIEHTNATAIILDPIAAHFTPERRVHDRATLRKLIAMARRRRCSIIGVHHTVKTNMDGTGIGAIGGPSGGLAGSSRAAFLYGYDPEDEDRRALVCVKINGVDEPPALILEHETIEYDAAGQLVEAGKLIVVGEQNVEGRSVLRRGRVRKDRDAECLKWLTLFLAAGDDCKRQVGEIRREGRAAGYGWQTLLRARVGLSAERVKVGFGGDGFWLWRLPDEHPLREENAAVA